jgi:hypothetical protein
MFPSVLLAIDGNDNTITWEVIPGLIGEEGIDSHLIDVGVNEGIAALAGSVKNLLAKERATQIAVEVETHRPDEEIEAEIERRLRRDV